MDAASATRSQPKGQLFTPARGRLGGPEAVPRGAIEAGECAHRTSAARVAN